MDRAEIIEDGRAALAGWRLMETAPKDGTRILAVGQDSVVRITHWGVMYRVTSTEPPDYVPTETSAPQGWIGMFPIGDPVVTRWMPLPPA